MADMTFNQDAGGYYLSGSYAFVNNEVDETVKTLDIPMSGLVYGRAYTHRITVYNPGAVDVTARFMTGELIGGSVRYTEVTNLTVTAAADLGTILVDGLLNASTARITVENDTVVGGAGAFTASVVCRGVQ